MHLSVRITRILVGHHTSGRRRKVEHTGKLRIAFLVPPNVTELGISLGNPKDPVFQGRLQASPRKMRGSSQ